ncbi:MAG: hypothetical protein J0L92_07520 [Deltaproteobacteria bacterium]|nr:hypothetical protein [Deltaproteobacteria bacterium]
MRRLCVVMWVVLCSCASTRSPADADETDAAAGRDGGRADATDTRPVDAWGFEDAACTTDEDCDDGIFCNGAERCVGPCLSDGSPCRHACDELTQRCCEDRDNDGVPEPGCTEEPDCDETSAAVYPGAPEECNTLDDDCDGRVDEGFAVERFVADCDVDGFGDAAHGTMDCQPPGSKPPSVCEAGWWSRIDGDCDDLAPDVHPKPIEEACDGLDDDCDGSVDHTRQDLDGDGFVAFACDGTMDCRDDYAGAYPGAPEACDGIDTDCDGTVEDRDGDGHLALTAPCVGGPLPRDDCDDARFATRPGAIEVCNTIDDDCDGVVDPTDALCVSHGSVTECRAGVCRDLACGTVWGRCDDVDHCTTRLDLDERHCGACGVVCASAACVDRGCVSLAQLALSSARSVALVADQPLWIERIGARLGDDHRFLAARVIGGGERVCYVWSDDRVSCDGSFDTVSIAGVAEVASASRFACARDDEGRVWCWGEGPRGELGDGALHPMSSPPVRVSGIEGASAIGVGGRFACTLAAGRVWCWGSGYDGALGNGLTVDVMMPVEALLPTSAIAMATGDAHACAVLSDASVWCWGSNARGQLGVGVGTVRATTPRLVSAAPPATSCVAAGDATCILTTSGERWCWGANDGAQLGDGSRVDRFAPTSAETDVGRVWLARRHGCREGLDRSIACWGSNADGRLGDGTSLDALRPVVLDYTP